MTTENLVKLLQIPAGAVRIKMHNKLPAVVALGKYLGMFDQRPQNSARPRAQRRQGGGQALRCRAIMAKSLILRAN
jgi:hypothetical protein